MGRYLVSLPCPRPRKLQSKHLLETTADPVEAVAEAVGYEDASFFGRLFPRKVGLTPTQYRKRFGGLRRSLQAQVG